MSAKRYSDFTLNLPGPDMMFHLSKGLRLLAPAQIEFTFLEADWTQLESTL